MDKRRGHRRRPTRRTKEETETMPGERGELDKVCKNKKVRLTTTIRLLDALVLPVALYGCETWARTQNEDTRIAAFEMKCIRRILDIKWEEKVSNEKITKN